MDHVQAARAGWLPHLLASFCALSYALFISGTSLRTTGMQFVMPVMLILMTHLIWLSVKQQLRAGFLAVVLRRATLTSGVIVLGLFGGSIFAPDPAFANGTDIGGIILMIVFCGAIIALVVFLIVGAVRLLFAGLNILVGTFTKKNGPDSRLFDVSGLAVTFAFLMVASLEGLPQAYQFASQGSATARVQIDAPAGDVWGAMNTATSPDFDLPAILSVFPQPVAVSVDDGVGLGAHRVVAFAGREGAGALHLQVTARSETSVVFTVLSDTTPYAEWISYRTLTYEVRPYADQTILSVTLAFDRVLSPAWFFNPAMTWASYLAMNVLAQDVAQRAQN